MGRALKCSLGSLGRKAYVAEPRASDVQAAKLLAKLVADGEDMAALFMRGLRYSATKVWPYTCTPNVHA